MGAFDFVCDFCRHVQSYGLLQKGWMMFGRVNVARSTETPKLRHACPSCVAVISDLLEEHGFKLL